jgi:APA family basic amino acid/polyamine antiporter
VTSDSPRGGGLRRALGPGLLTVLVVGDILGAGIYVLVGEVASDLGGFLWLPFLVAMLLAGLTASSYVELASAHPHAAGSSRYVQVAFDRPVFTFMMGFVVAASAMTTAAAVSRAVGGQYLSAFVEWPAQLVALATIVILSVVVWVGIAESARANAVMTLVEVGGLLLVIAAGVGGFLDGTAEPSRLLETGGADPGTFAVLGATALAFFAYLGFEDAVHLAEEVERPARSFPIALFGGLAIVGLLYMGVTVSAGSLVAPDTLAASDTPLLDALATGPVPVSDEAFALIAIVAVTNTALLALTTASRQVYGLAEQGAAPAALARVGRRRTPTVAIVGVGGVVAVLAVTGGVRQLADTTVALLLAVFAVVNLTVLVLRRRAPAGAAEAGDDSPDAQKTFRTPTWAAVGGALGSAGLLANTLWTGGVGLLLRLAGLLGLTLVLYALTRRR